MTDDILAAVNSELGRFNAKLAVLAEAVVKQQNSSPEFDESRLDALHHALILQRQDHRRLEHSVSSLREDVDSLVNDWRDFKNLMLQTVYNVGVPSVEGSFSGSDSGN